jgi:CubicO group peptidase (beta-lactamase class C family)
VPIKWDTWSWTSHPGQSVGVSHCDWSSSLSRESRDAQTKPRLAVATRFAGMGVTVHLGPGHTRAMGGALSQLHAWPVKTAAAGVTSAERTLGTAGDGTKRFRWASVTKLLTALATLVAVEEGTVALDDPAGPAGSTVRHLLAHASGLPLEGSTPIAPPGRRRIYSNAGFELLAQVVAQGTDMALADYLQTGVIVPLALSTTTLTGSAASGAVGSLDDLLTLGRELLRPRLIAPETLAAAVEVQFPGLSGVLPGFGRQSPNDWGLGFELRDTKSPHWTGRTNSAQTFGHFGQSGSMLWVDPGAGLACASLADRDFGPWAAEAWPRLSDAVLAEYKNQYR